MFTIAQKNHVVAGHGDSYDELVIRKEGDYGTEKFPPLFYTELEAEQYLANNSNKFFGAKVVELKIYLKA